MAYTPMSFFPQNYQPLMPPQYSTQIQQPAGRMIEVVPVDNEEAAAAFPVQVGATQVMFARDDSFIAVKSSNVNGQSSFDIYDKRPPAPPQPAFDPQAYVTKDELEKRLAAILARTGDKTTEADK